MRLKTGLVTLLATVILASVSQGQQSLDPPKTWQEDARDAIVGYVDETAKETIKSQSKAAITALYKKLYKSGADKAMVRQLGNVALSANEINDFAEKAAEAMVSGDPEAVKAATGDIALALGKTLAGGLKDPALRQQMLGALGNVDRINEAAEVLGSAAGGDRQQAYEYLGRAFISMTPAAGVLVAAETAAGAMSYAHGKFIDNEMEELYREYAEGDDYTREAIREKLETGRIYSSIIGTRRRELADERAQDISLATAEPSDEVRKRLTDASEGEVVDDILQTFAARVTRDEARAATEKARTEAATEASLMLEALDTSARGKFGKDWWKTRNYNLERFTQIIRDRLKRDGVLDPRDPTHIKAMASLLSTGMVHGKDSDEYKEKLKQFEDYRKLVGGIEAGEGSDPGPAIEGLTEYPGETTDLGGSYSGRIGGEASGNMTLNVSGTSVSGSISGSYDGDGYRASFSGSLGADGAFSAPLRGALVSGKTSYVFNGTISGRINGVSGQGEWSGRNKYGAANGTWQVGR